MALCSESLFPFLGNHFSVKACSCATSPREEALVTRVVVPLPPLSCSAPGFPSGLPGRLPQF